MGRFERNMTIALAGVALFGVLALAMPGLSLAWLLGLIMGAMLVFIIGMKTPYAMLWRLSPWLANWAARRRSDPYKEGQ